MLGTQALAQYWVIFALFRKKFNVRQHGLVRSRFKSTSCRWGQKRGVKACKGMEGMREAGNLGTNSSLAVICHHVREETKETPGGKERERERGEKRERK